MLIQSLTLAFVASVFLGSRVGGLFFLLLLAGSFFV